MLWLNAGCGVIQTVDGSSNLSTPSFTTIIALLNYMICTRSKAQAVSPNLDQGKPSYEL